jgi:quinol monooxygenase YgiN
MEDTRLYIFARFHALDGHERDVAEALRDEVPLARSEAGCVNIDAFQATHNPQLFFIHSCWKDEPAFETHVKLPHTMRFLERVSAAIDHPLEVTRTRILD